jgi:hypothetical protein
MQIGIWDERKVFGSRGQILKEEFVGRHAENNNRDVKPLNAKPTNVKPMNVKLVMFLYLYVYVIYILCMLIVTPILYFTFYRGHLLGMHWIE